MRCRSPDSSSDPSRRNRHSDRQNNLFRALCCPRIRPARSVADRMMRSGKRLQAGRQPTTDRTQRGGACNHRRRTRKSGRQLWTETTADGNNPKQQATRGKGRHNQRRKTMRSGRQPCTEATGDTNPNLQPDESAPYAQRPGRHCGGKIGRAIKNLGFR